MTRFFSRVRSSSRSKPQRIHACGGSARIILLYHRVAVPSYDPFHLAVSPARFRDQLEVLQSCCELVTLDEILDRPHTSDPLAAITFDDGYADNLTVASPILSEAGIPATYFICTGALGSARGFWWDRLANAIAAAREPAAALAALGVGAVAAEIATPADRDRAAIELADRLRALHPTVREEAVARVEDAVLPAGGAPEACPVLDETGVRELAARPWSELGAHTEGHPALAYLSFDEQVEEIRRGVATLHSITGTWPRFLAYPFGTEHDYNGDSIAAAGDGGFRAAFVNHWTRFDPERDPYRIPRYAAPALPAPAFRTWLDGILAG
jgi:peptidoglycan/xylan/chitin deacetylase (PgdA/CDA1 family)